MAREIVQFLKTVRNKNSKEENKIKWHTTVSALAPLALSPTTDFDISKLDVHEKISS